MRRTAARWLEGVPRGDSHHRLRPPGHPLAGVAWYRLGELPGLQRSQRGAVRAVQPAAAEAPTGRGPRPECAGHRWRGPRGKCRARDRIENGTEENPALRPTPPGSRRGSTRGDGMEHDAAAGARGRHHHLPHATDQRRPLPHPASGRRAFLPSPGPASWQGDHQRSPRRCGR